MTKQSRKLMMGAVTGAAVLATGQANAFQFSAGDVTGYLDTTLKFGGIIRVDERSAVTSQSLGNTNYDDGDFANFTLSGTVDFGVSYGDYGAFIRANALYDPVIEDKSDAEVPQEAKDIAGSDVLLLDHYVYGNWILGDHYLSARVGSQVINWGESVFTANGLNVVNPVDLAKLRVPGAELKEGLIPVNSFWFSATLTDNLSLEAYYKFEWEQILLDPVGTYFSTSDAIGAGSTTVAGLARGENQYADADEYGLSFRYIVEQWDSAEIGVYAIRYNNSAPGLVFDFTTGFYNEAYAEEIDLFGLTLSTVLFEHSVSLEYTYRDNLPVAVANAVAPGVTVIHPSLGTLAGTQEAGVSQLLVNDVYAYGPNNPIGADQFSTVIEVGYVLNHDHDTATGFTSDENSLGFRVRVTADYNNAIGNWTLKPLLDISAGVDGNAANRSFTEDVVGVTTSLEGVLLSKYSLQVVYSFQNGKGSGTRDRDYIGFNGKVSF